MQKGIWQLTLWLYSSMTFGLVLEPIQIHSYLNQPLRASVLIKDVKPLNAEELTVQVPSVVQFQKAGIEKGKWIDNLQFELVKHDEGILLKLRTSIPLKDPFAQLMLEVNSPSASATKEYTLLLDLPETATSTGLNVKTPKSSHVLNNTVTKNKIEPHSIPNSLKLGGEYQPVEKDTLWSLSTRLVQNTPFSVYEGMEAIMAKNPQIFKTKNRHQLPKVYTLSLPTLNEIKNGVKKPASLAIAPAVQKSPKINKIAPIPDFKKNELSHDMPKPIKSSIPENAVLDKPLKISQPLAQDLDLPLLSSAQERLNRIEETMEVLKRTNEDMVEKNKNLHEKNESLMALMQIKEEEIKQLKQAPISSQPVEINNEIVATLDDNVVKEPEIALAPLPLAELPQPVLAKPQPQPAKNNWIETFLIGLVLIMGSIASYIWVHRKRNMNNTQVNSEVNSPDALSDLKRYDVIAMKTKSNEQTEEMSSLIEAVKIYINYEKYTLAQSVLEDMLEQSPDYGQALILLLEIHVYLENYHEFNQLYLRLQKLPTVWHENKVKIVTLHAKMLEQQPICFN